MEFGTNESQPSCFADGHGEVGDRISADIFGFEESAEIITTGLEHMEKAIELIPKAEKAAYQQAKERHFNLFHNESKPILFLRREKYNAWAAARRIVTYWKKRVILFGDRAFLPMNLTGEGSLLEKDMTVFDDGGIAILPNDKKNRIVVYFDLSAVASERALFFVMQTLIENERSKSIFLLPMGLASGANFNQQAAKTLSSLIRDCLPMEPPEFHVVWITQEGSSFLEQVDPQTRTQLGPYLCKLAVKHVADSNKDALGKLLECGLKRECLPVSLGGTLDNECFKRWQRRYGRADRLEYLTSLVQKSLASYSALKMASHCVKEVNPVYVPGRQRFRNQARFPDSEAEIMSINSVNRKHLTAAEKDKILKDIFGTDQLPYAVANEIRSNQEKEGLVQLQEALSLIPNKEKAAYVEALNCAPKLVELESAPIRFLRHAEFNPWAAASRLCIYWKERKDLFGAKAFLPLTLCGNGALSQDEVSIARTGYIQLLPRDRGGRPVSYHDRSRLTDPSMLDMKKRLRCVFYWFSVISDSEAARKRGHVGVSVYGENATFALADSHFIKRSAHIFNNVFPVTMKAVHLVCLTEKKSFTESLIPSVHRIISRGRRFTGDRTIVHIKKTPKDLMDALEKFGLRKDGLPTAIGGNWGMVDFQRWLKGRARVEAGLHALGAERETGSALHSCDIQQGAIESPPGKRRQPDTVSVTAAEAEARRAKKRKMDVIYARRKRERERIEIEVLQEQREKLASKNTRLRCDNKMLESILKYAVEAMAKIDESVSLQLSSVPAGRSLKGTPHASRSQLPANGVSGESRFW